MKYIILLLTSIALSSTQTRAQVIDYAFIESIATQPDSLALRSLLTAGYTPNKEGDYRFIVDNKIKAFVTYVKANPDSGQDHSYWAFQVRNKKSYSDILKQVKKDAQTKEGFHFGKPRTEYKSPEGLYYYPFEDSMFKGLYWVYVSRASLLEYK